MPLKDISLFNVDDFYGNQQDKDCVYEEITICPNCHVAAIPKILHGYYVKNESSNGSPYHVNIAMFCVNCRRIFMAKYSATLSSKGYNKVLYAKTIEGLYPSEMKEKEFSPAIKVLSPLFVTTYSQSEAAYNAQSFEIAGCGYRKSIEYLIKDYLCHKYPKNSEVIKGEFLGNTIKRIEDSRIKTLAERATWIGNDETHYIKKHEDLDIQDMIRFIDALLHYVEAELTFEEALSVSHK